MAGTPETPAIRALDLESIVPAGVSFSDPEPLPRHRRKSPTVLAALALLAGLGAMVLGGAAVVSAGRDGDDSIVAQSTPTQAPAAATRTDRGTVLFLAKPSTQRIPFTGSAGRLVLAVGSGGRAAIVVRSGWQVPAGKSYGAWVVRRDGSLRRAAVFTASKRVVPLSKPLPRPATVVVAPQRSDGSPSAARQRVVARLGR